MDSSFESYLQETGLIKQVKSADNLNLRLYHDLNVYGDIAESCIEHLRDKYGVDIDGFIFEDYFPSEFVGESFLESCMYSILPFLRKKHDSKIELKPLTLLNIEQAMQEKVLV